MLCQQFRNAESDEEKKTIAFAIATIENKATLGNKYERRSIFDYIKNLGDPDLIVSGTFCSASWNLSEEESLELRSTSMQTQGLVDRAEITSGVE